MPRGTLQSGTYSNRTLRPPASLVAYDELVHEGRAVRRLIDPREMIRSNPLQHLITAAVGLCTVLPAPSMVFQGVAMAMEGHAGT